MTSMRRRVLFVLVTVLWGCSQTAKPLADALPAELPGGWKRGAVAQAATVPEQAATLGVDETAQTTYTGSSGSVEVSAYRMRTDTSAFELMQRWRHDEGAAAYKGAVFYVARATDRQAALAVLRALQ
jgi:hypothetical protein